MQKSIFKEIMKVWKKAVKEEKGWVVHELKVEKEGSPSYCLLGVLGCEKGFNVHYNSCEDKNGYAMRFSEILLAYNIPLKNIVQIYSCHKCGATGNLASMIPHLNDSHYIDFKGALKQVPKLKKKLIMIDSTELRYLTNSPYLTEEDKKYLVKKKLI